MLDLFAYQTISPLKTSPLILISGEAIKKSVTCGRHDAINIMKTFYLIILNIMVTFFRDITKIYFNIGPSPGSGLTSIYRTHHMFNQSVPKNRFNSITQWRLPKP